MGTRTVVYHEKVDDSYTGRTFAVIHSGDIRHIGISVCSFRGDNFSRKLGHAIAMGRAHHMFSEYNSIKTVREKRSAVQLDYPLMQTVNLLLKETHSEIPEWMMESK